jgi:hypothetical protein
MYNLIVSGNSDSWSGEHFIIDLDRCLTEREFTNKNVAEIYGKELRLGKIDELMHFPCIFAYEISCNKDPKFGKITEITVRDKNVRIKYEIIELQNFITTQDILDDMFAFGISSDWEMSRKHWAIKEVDLKKELLAKEIQLPAFEQTGRTVDVTTHFFDVALSFPGEKRTYVREVAEKLEIEIGRNSFFYDENYQSQLARPSLDTLLQDIYCNRSKLIVVFLCSHYQEKNWCGIEFKAIKEIIFKREHKRIMFVRLDDGLVDGVFGTDGYIDGRKHDTSQVVEFIKERLDLCDM